MINELNNLPENLPTPADDGACDHLTGLSVPSIPLPATDGTTVDLSRLPGRSIVFFYPRTGTPAQPSLVPDWNQIPGARGCTPQTCGFRDLAVDFAAHGYRVFGASTQLSAYQVEMVKRLHVPFPVLSDAALNLIRALALPTFTAAGEELVKRMTWILEDGRIIKVFYPVFPPDRNAINVLNWIEMHPNQ